MQHPAALRNLLTSLLRGHSLWHGSVGLVLSAACPRPNGQSSLEHLSVLCRAHTTGATIKGSSIDPQEAKKFAALASSWWAPRGPFAPLHRLNSARSKFIRDTVCAMQGLEHRVREPLAGLQLLDVGCGGGILAESMARLGASTHGIDITEENIQAARVHAAQDPLIQARLRYDCVPLEHLAERAGSSPTAHPVEPNSPPSGPHKGPPYAVVLASEVVEHVNRPDLFIKALASVLAPGGTLVLSTINRTPESYAVAILGAEYITRIVPAGTHDWNKFITPEEMYLMASEAGLSLAHTAGMGLQGGQFVLTTDLSVNYIAAFHKPANLSAQ